MILAVNIGNSNIRFGIFLNDEKCVQSWTIPTSIGDKNTYFEIKNLFLKYKPEKDIVDIVIGSVVPNYTHQISSMLYRVSGIKPTIVDRSVSTKVNISHVSSKLGTDLYANAVYADAEYDAKKAKIVVDFGTALTFICVDKESTLKGAVIAPGVKTSFNSLLTSTAQLSDIQWNIPKKILGDTTEKCLQSGIIFGYLSMVEGVIDRIEQEIGEETCVIATGGLCELYAPLTPKIQHCDILHTLKGLMILNYCSIL
ncbi:MAG: type III pantothenate kinase [Bacteroidales bacterium]|jgi:type III pantothenate kinase|nr:type III pantothenate kinase [Bacteroidales bacterium]